MFDLGNGVWIAPEFVASVVRHREDGQEWVTVTMSDSRSGWELSLNDQKVIEPFTDGLLTLGYASCDDFCEKLLTAIKEAKHG